ncbi:uncharacterized protein [Saccopteryx leptura]|uniref:uncharacterized protein n=1 Tax=Saccopteryx leptura TaxID=249018 RepID=UPI00339C3F19
MLVLLRINLVAGIYPLALPHQGSLPWSAPAQDTPASCRESQGAEEVLLKLHKAGLTPSLEPSSFLPSFCPVPGSPGGQRVPLLPAGTRGSEKWVPVGRKEVLTEQRPPHKLCPHAGCPSSGLCLLGMTPPGWDPCGLTATLLPARAIGQHLVRSAPRPRMMQTAASASRGGWRARGLCYRQGTVPRTQGKVCQPGPSVARRSLNVRKKRPWRQCLPSQPATSPWPLPDAEVPAVSKIRHTAMPRRRLLTPHPLPGTSA